MKKILVLLFVFILIFSFTGCSKKEAETASTFKVGLECNYAPFNWTQTDDSNGAVAIDGGGGYCGGYDVEIAKTIASSLGKELVIVKTEWDGLIPAVNSGKIDAVIAGMSPTEERKASVDFSEPYYESDLVIVVRADGPYAEAKSLEDFAGAKITGQLNTFHDSVVDQIPNVDHVTAMETFPAMIVALNAGKVDGYVSERPGAVSAKESNTELTFVEFEEGKGFEASPEDVAVAVAMKKGSADITAVNEALKALDKDKRQEMMDAAIVNQPVAQE